MITTLPQNLQSLYREIQHLFCGVNKTAYTLGGKKLSNEWEEHRIG